MKRSRIPHWGADDAAAAAALARPVVAPPGWRRGQPGLDEGGEVSIALTVDPEALPAELGPEERMGMMAHGAPLAWQCRVRKANEVEVAQALSAEVHAPGGPVLVPFPIWEGSNIITRRGQAYAVRAELRPRAGAYVDEYRRPQTGEREREVALMLGPGGMHAPRYVWWHTDQGDLAMRVMDRATGQPTRAARTWYRREAIERACARVEPHLAVDPGSEAAVRAGEVLGASVDQFVGPELLDAVQEMLNDPRAPDPAWSVRALPRQRVVTALETLGQAVRAEGEDLLSRALGEGEGLGEIDWTGTGEACAARLAGWLEGQGQSVEDALERWARHSRAVRLSIDAGAPEVDTQGTWISHEPIWFRRANEMVVQGYRARWPERPMSARIESETRCFPPHAIGFADPSNNAQSARTGLTVMATQHAACVARNGIWVPALAGHSPDGAQRVEELRPGLRFAGPDGTVLDTRGEPSPGPAPGLVLDEAFDAHSAHERFGSAQRTAHGRRYHERAVAPEREHREDPIVVHDPADPGRAMPVHTFALRTAVLDGDARTHEDAVIMSRTAAAAMRLTERRTVRLERSPHERWLGGTEIVAEGVPDALGMSPRRFDLIGDDALPGGPRMVRAGDVLRVRRSAAAPGYEIECAGASLAGGRIETVSVTGAEVEGSGGRETVELHWTRTRSHQVNDKVSTQDGVKGMVQVLPDEEMPTDRAGEPVDMVVSGSSIVARMATGTLHRLRLSAAADRALDETRTDWRVLGEALAGAPAAGLPVDETLGIPGAAAWERLRRRAPWLAVASPDGTLEPLAERLEGPEDCAGLRDRLLWLGLPGADGAPRLERLRVSVPAGLDQESAREVEEALDVRPGEEAGCAHADRAAFERGETMAVPGALATLPVIVMDLNGDRNYSVAPLGWRPTHPLTGQAAASSEANPARLGKMEVAVLHHAGAGRVLENLAELAETGTAHDHRDAWEAGVPAPRPRPAEALRNVERLLAGQGLRRGPDGALRPLTDAEVRRLAPGEVRCEVREPEAEGGLRDPATFGQGRDAWGRIELPCAVVHPLALASKGNSPPYLARLLGLTAGELRHRARSDVGAPRQGERPSPLADPRVRRGVPRLSGPEWIEERLRAIEENLPGALADARTALERSRARLQELDEDGPTQGRARREVRRGVDRVEALEELASHPDHRPSSWIVRCLPVVPVHLRTPAARDGADHEHDLDVLYRGVLNACRRIRDATVTTHRAPRVLGATLERLCFGTWDAATGRRRQGLVRATGGKHGAIGQTVEGFNVCGSMRSTILPADPGLDPGTIEIPGDAARRLLEPRVVQALGDAYGLERDQARRELREGTERARDLLRIAGAVTVAIRNRAPTLHEHSMGAVRLVPREGGARDTSVRIHPMTCGWLNADFDGDAIREWVLTREEAAFEAMRRLGTAASLAKRGTGESLVTPEHAALSGLAHALHAERGAGADPHERLCAWAEEDDGRDREAAQAAGEATPRDLDAGALVHAWCDEFVARVRGADEETRGAALRRMAGLWERGFEASRRHGSSIRLEALEVLRDVARTRARETGLLARVEALHLPERPDEAARERYAKGCAQAMHDAVAVLRSLRDDPATPSPARALLRFADRSGRVTLRQLVRTCVFAGAPMDLAQRPVGRFVATPLLEAAEEADRGALAHGVATAFGANQDALAKGTHIGSVGRDTGAHMPVVEADCGIPATRWPTRPLGPCDEGLIYARAPKDRRGRVLRNEDGTEVRAGDPVRPGDRERLDGMPVRVRSLAGCTSDGGCCRACHGQHRATGDAPVPGSNPGIGAWEAVTEITNQEQLRRFKEDGGIASEPAPTLTDALAHGLGPEGVIEAAAREAAEEHTGSRHWAHRVEQRVSEAVLERFEAHGFGELDPAHARAIAHCLVPQEEPSGAGPVLSDLYEVGLRRTHARHTTHMKRAESFAAAAAGPGLRVDEPTAQSRRAGLHTELEAHWAAVRDDRQALTRLVRDDPDALRRRDQDGHTAVWYARSAAAARLLVDAGLSGLEPDTLGVRPVDAALVRALPEGTEHPRRARADLVRAVAGARVHAAEIGPHAAALLASQAQRDTTKGRERT